MISRRRLNKAHDEGRRDGFMGAVPGMAFLDRYERWAYEAGYSDGKRDLRRHHEATERLSAADALEHP